MLTSIVTLLAPSSQRSERERERDDTTFPMDQLFSAKPKPFRIHRKSPIASKIKSSISVKLSEFLGGYTDDVFLEYITVLICNGKDQYQARDDLEAFLGERSEEFVSWLWDLLFKLAGKFCKDTDYLDEVPGISPPNSDSSIGAKVDRCTDFRSHVNELLMRGDKMRHSACDPASCNDMRLAKGSQHYPSVSVPSTEVNTALSHGCRNEILRRYMASGDIDGEGDRRTQSKNQITQIVSHKCSGLPRERLHLPEREAMSKNTELSVSGRQFSARICASNKIGTSVSQRSIGAGSIRSKKSRGSVWDRLGKPCEDISGGLKSVDFYGAGHNKQCDKVNQLALVPPKRNSEVPAFDKKRLYSNPVEMEKLDHVDNAVSEPHFANNIGRKRLFGEISPECEDTSQHFKKSDVATNDLKTIQELLHLKEKLNQVEIEMSKLRSKQVEFEKNDGKTNHLLNSGAPKDSEETFESRTVLVTNVHFAATREALSLYFAKCGMIVNVMILTDTVTSKPKGSAYVTFASKESVDKAVALSGATFFCRTLKVLRMAGAAVEASAPTQLPEMTSLNIPHGNRIAFPSKPHYMRSTLQWRREPGVVPSELPCPAGVGVSSSAHEQHISISNKDRKTSSLEPP
ncbi:putative PWI domain, nucleotide-binding alpha-beta plait domain-containing protein [Rosa chinensis]|uniref:Putative PWI domain, nucleotide-binding alpha-beta plait domain-containing protein n=1 Tax=Rosa chinensis TaxID=74649 RepID=A0A2P6RZV3_ROSCH|nr:uncharacterized protein LOC112190552 isoform X2 [Rosa chinensis]PRQ51939.1 putative PWI domain, nucleotide-binding alpha-beta plait domain-containing protein [Rosa chinensis]